jgi:hypothetical protein
VAKGCHDGTFWQSVAPAQLHFLAAALVNRRGGPGDRRGGPPVHWG